MGVLKIELALGLVGVLNGLDEEEEDGFLDLEDVELDLDLSDLCFEDEEVEDDCLLLRLSEVEASFPAALLIACHVS